MKLTLHRKHPTETGIPGDLFIDDVRECHTLENKAKAIPCGTFDIELEYSPRFGRLLPELKGIPGRTECKFHTANWPHQLEGCIAVGRVSSTDYVGESKKALDALVQKLIVARNRKEAITVEITEPTIVEV